jgi:hypothetical protein
MKFKEFKIDLGGSYLAKAKAVCNHAKTLGFTSWYLVEEERYLFFGKNKACKTNSVHVFEKDYTGEQVTAEKFLELTKEDVIEKEPELFYRYRIWFKDGSIQDTSSFFYEKGEALFLAGNHMEMYANIAKYERIGEGVAGL